MNLSKNRWSTRTSCILAKGILPACMRLVKHSMEMENKIKWIINSGVTDHMTSNFSLFFKHSSITLLDILHYLGTGTITPIPFLPL